MATTNVSRGKFAQSIVTRMDKLARAQVPRDYIGASIIGTPCDRALFYCKEQVPTPAPKHPSQRIFDFGDATELLLIKWLRDAGYHVYDRDPRSNEQFRVSAVDRAYQGHADGLICSTSLLPHLFSSTRMDPVSAHDDSTIRVLEAKSHKDTRFYKVVDLGVKAGYFDHYAQLQIYMGESSQLLEPFGLFGNVHQGLYAAVNKNTSEVYFEEVSFDQDCFLRLASRARRIKSATAPPPRIADSLTKSPCKYCDYKIHCYLDTRAEEVRI